MGLYPKGNIFAGDILCYQLSNKGSYVLTISRIIQLSIRLVIKSVRGIVMVIKGIYILRTDLLLQFSFLGLRNRVSQVRFGVKTTE